MQIAGHSGVGPLRANPSLEMHSVWASHGYSIWYEKSASARRSQPPNNSMEPTRPARR